jgi:steroid delta-isomerase-like uncharacterized protein
MMAMPDNAALARLMYDAFNINDLDTILAYTSDDVELVLMPFDLHFHGLEGFREFIQRVKTALPDCTARLVSQINHEAGVVNELVAQGTHTGPLVGPYRQIPATGRVISYYVCEVWDVNNGKLTKLRSYFDTLTMLRQLGVRPEVT